MSTTPTVHDASAPTLGEAAGFLLSQEEKDAVQQHVTQARVDQGKYLRDHPEIDEIFSLAFARLLREQPTDAEEFLVCFFADNDLEEVVEGERAAAAERDRISTQAGREPMDTLF